MSNREAKSEILESFIRGTLKKEFNLEVGVVAPRRPQTDENDRSLKSSLRNEHVPYATAVLKSNVAFITRMYTIFLLRRARRQRAQEHNQGLCRYQMSLLISSYACPALRRT